VLQTKTLEILIGSKIHAANRLQNTDRRCVRTNAFPPFASKKPHCGDDRDQVISKGSHREEKNQCAPNGNARECYRTEGWERQNLDFRVLTQHNLVAAQFITAVAPCGFCP